MQYKVFNDAFSKIVILICNLNQKIDNATLPARRGVSFAPLHIRNHLLLDLDLQVPHKSSKKELNLHRVRGGGGVRVYGAFLFRDRSQYAALVGVKAF